MDKLIDQKTLVVIIGAFLLAIVIGLSIPAVIIKDAPKCGQEKDVNGEWEQICRDQHHYISLYTKLFVTGGDKPRGDFNPNDHHLTK